jgi:hypothetical protein
MSKCKCLSAPQYHRDDCPSFDSFGNKKTIDNSMIYFISDSLKNNQYIDSFQKNPIIFIAFDELGECLSEVLQESKKRKQILRAFNCNDLLTFNQQNRPLNLITIILDNRIAQLSNGDYKDQLTEIMQESKLTGLSIIIKNT